MGEIYIGVNNAPKRIKSLWIGVDGVPKKIKNAWIGVNDLPKVVYTSLGKAVITSVTIDGTVYWDDVPGAVRYKVKKYQNGSWITSSVFTANTYYQLASFDSSVTKVAVIAYDARTSTANTTVSDDYIISWITITFNGNGGTPSKSSLDMLKNSAIGTLPTASRSGYDFDYWTNGSTSGSRVYETTVFNSDRILYAHWTQTYVYYIVTFDPNGGTCPTSSKEVRQGSTIGTLPTPTRGGYNFVNWTVNGSVINSSYKPQSDCTAIADWSLILQSSRITSADHSGYVTFISATGASYYRIRKYQGSTWYTSVKTTNTYITLQSMGTTVSKLTVIAYDDYGNSIESDEYEINWIKITFNGNGGTPFTSYYNRIVSYDSYYPMTEEVGELPTASRSGYIFDGWYTGTGAYSSKVYPTSKYNSSRTVYAHWIEQELEKPVITSAVKSTKKVTWTKPLWATKVVLYKSGNSTGTAQNRTIIYASNGHKLSSTESIDTYTGVFLTGTSHTYSNTNYMYEVCVVAWDENGNHVASDWYTAT